VGVESYGSVGYGGVARGRTSPTSGRQPSAPSALHPNREDLCRLPYPRHRAARSR
jgi:hypothetical protein